MIAALHNVFKKKSLLENVTVFKHCVSGMIKPTASSLSVMPAPPLSSHYGPAIQQNGAHSQKYTLFFLPSGLTQSYHLFSLI